MKVVLCLHVHDVLFHRTDRKHLHHPVAGDLDLTHEAFELPGDAGDDDTEADAAQAASQQSRERLMEILTKQPTAKGPAQMFTGDAWYDVIVRGEAPSRVRANTVRFAPGARTAWHSHAVGQTLYVTEGRGLVQSRGGGVVELRPGDVVWTPPGEEHWHGAAPGHFMTHIAIWEAPDDDREETTWGEQVTDAEYGIHQH